MVSVHLLLTLIDDSILHLVFSTVILIVCFGSVATRDSYKNYLMSAFRGELTTCKLHHAQLLQDKNLPEMGFGQTLIWLNYRYYIAIMLFFIIFGAPGVVFYRLVITLNEKQDNDATSAANSNSSNDSKDSVSASSTIDVNEADDETENISAVNDLPTKMTTEACQALQQLLFWLDWLPVRLTTFGYMMVGHFSKALPVWLESFFEFEKPAAQILGDVAKKSEDMMVDEQDCTAEPCLLVRLAKRNLLLLLAVIAVLTLSGVIS